MAAVDASDSQFVSEYLAKLRILKESGVKSLKQSLHHFLNLVILEVKFTNPSVAATGGRFHVRDIANGLFQSQIEHILRKYFLDLLKLGILTIYCSIT